MPFPLRRYSKGSHKGGQFAPTGRPDEVETPIPAPAAAAGSTPGMLTSAFNECRFGVKFIGGVWHGVSSEQGNEAVAFDGLYPEEETYDLIHATMRSGIAAELLNSGEMHSDDFAHLMYRTCDQSGYIDPPYEIEQMPDAGFDYLSMLVNERINHEYDRHVAGAPLKYCHGLSGTAPEDVLRNVLKNNRLQGVWQQAQTYERLVKQAGTPSPTKIAETTGVGVRAGKTLGTTAWLYDRRIPDSLNTAPDARLSGPAAALVLLSQSYNMDARSPEYKTWAQETILGEHNTAPVGTEGKVRLVVGAASSEDEQKRSSEVLSVLEVLP